MLCVMMGCMHAPRGAMGRSESWGLSACNDKQCGKRPLIELLRGYDTSMDTC